MATGYIGGAGFPDHLCAADSGRDSVHSRVAGGQTGGD